MATFGITGTDRLIHFFSSLNPLNCGVVLRGTFAVAEYGVEVVLSMKSSGGECGADVALRVALTG